MQYRLLGDTGLRVSVLGFGGSPLGGVFGQVDEAEARRAVRSAIEKGINYFDTAPFYGETKAETVLGKALQGIPREEYYLATKVGRYGAREFDFSAGRSQRSVDESLERLGVDYVDLIQCHDIEFGDLNQVVGETIPALRDLQKAGKARFVGITGFPLGIYHPVMSRIQVDAVLSYCHYSLNNTSLGRITQFLRDQNVGVINASPLSMGLLTNSGPPVWHPASDEIKEKCATAARYCAEKGVDIASLAVRFAVSNPSVHTTLVGMATNDEVERNVAAASKETPMDLPRAVQDILAPIQNKTWSAAGQNIKDDEFTG